MSLAFSDFKNLGDSEGTHQLSEEDLFSPFSGTVNLSLVQIHSS